jgi:hypothetical protein
MSILRRVLVIIVILVYANNAVAQTVRVLGVVVDARTGRPLVGALAAIEGQPVFTETDSAGLFALGVPPGNHTLAISLIGYALFRQSLNAGGAEMPPLRIELSEGAGPFELHVTVSGVTPRDADAAPAGATLHGRDLQALRGVTLDDPLRAVHALPSVAATDDFYSEFAVRGLGFRYTGLIVDGLPSRYMMHAVHGVSDGGSITMLNSDAVASVSLLPGSYPQHYGRRMGSQVGITTREGDRSGFRARAGLSGTSATVLAEGPIGSRGSWLLSGRRSYLDLLLNRIDDENSLGFGFTDTEAKVVFDVTPRHQLQALAILGASKFEEDPEGLGLNNEARVSGRSWLSGASWRYAPSAAVALTQRLYMTGLAFDNTNRDGEFLDRSRSTDAGWRADLLLAPRPGWLIEIGADVQRITGRHAVRRSLNDAVTLATLNDYRADGSAASGYAQLTFNRWSRLQLSPGVRFDYWGLTDGSTPSPWLNVELRATETTRLRAGGGQYRQFADFEQMHGVRGGGNALRPETATHVDAGIIQALPRESTLQINWYAREERDVLWTPDAEPRRLPDNTVQLGRSDAKWSNALTGRARGVEVLLRRDAPAGLSGWVGYAYGRHRYTDAAIGETFASDADQRHALSLFGHYRVSNRATVGAKFRYGSNYPRVGYIVEQPPPSGAPALFGGDPPLFFGLSDTRNTLRLPAYARLDLRADRTYSWSRRRLTLFVEVANLLNRPNLRNVPYDVDRNGRVMGGTDSLMPILPSAGFVIEF